jgi:hypothetical protein
MAGRSPNITCCVGVTLVVARLAHPISGLPEIGTIDVPIGNSRRAMSAKGDHEGRPH